MVIIAADGWHDEVPGGANRLPTDFARYLASRGHAVAYVCASPSVRDQTASDVDGVKVWRYPTPRAASPNPLNGWQHVSSAHRIGTALRSTGSIAALLGHNQLQYLGVSAALGRGVRRAFGVHSPLVDELRAGVTGQPGWKHRAAWGCARQIERRALRMSDVVHFDSEFSRRLMTEEYPSEIGGKGIVLPGWVDVERFAAGGTRSAARLRLGAPWSSVPTFFSLRRLVPRMGLDLLVDAAAVLASEGRAFRVIVGGDGPERVTLESRVAAAGVGEHVTFVGRVASERLVDHFTAADWFVLPTRSLECFGLIVIEAFAAGTPVIGVPVGAIPEVMGPGLSDWIAAAPDVPSLATHMRAVLDGRLTVDPSRLRARAAQFALDVVCSRHENVLLNVKAAATHGAAVA